MQKRLIRRLLWGLGFGCLWLPLLDDPPLHSGAYLQRMTPDAVTIAMITRAGDVLRCEVRGPDGKVETMVSDQARRRHAFRFTGLTAGAEYEYEISSAHVRDQGRFRTAPVDDAAPVRFAFLGDSGKQPWWVWLQTAPILHLPARWDWLPPVSAVAGLGEAVAGYHPDFFLHLGDIVYPRGQHRHYGPGFFRPFAAALREAPFYTVLGNHDVMESGGLQALANFELPQNEVTGDERCFSFAFGSVRVICLEFNDMFFGPIGAGHPSLVYLERELQRRAEPWVVVASHFPILSASRQRNRPDLMLHLRPLLDDYAVSLYLSGHDHCYQRFAAERRDGTRSTPMVVSGGGGKSLYDVRMEPGVAAAASVFHWCGVEVKGGQMTLQTTALDGAVVDRLELDLHDDPRVPALAEKNPERAARIDALR